MCGISGIINQNNIEVPFEQIKKINDLIEHRGPDSEGFYLDKNFAFGHRRLSILDLSEDGHQPMHYMGRYTITYNGEVYNYLEIRQQLEQVGYKFKSNTDTEVILAAYDKWGYDCVKQFNGMWAFAIYDKKEQKIFCSRDRFGIKPFYYTKVEGKFIFGSEIKQLIEFHKERFVNKEILVDYLVTTIEDHTNATFFTGINKLEQSHNLIYDLHNDSILITKYYDISQKELKIDDENKAITNYEIEFNRAIDYRLRSDVKVGTCLSGGIDSSLIASVAASKYKNTFTAIHAKSFNDEADESEYAKLVADSSKNIDLKTVVPDQKDFEEVIDEVVYTQEEPFGSTSIFMQYFVMKKAKELGCTVLLDGQGGDETLLGYEKYYPAVYLDIFKKDGLIAAFKAVKASKKNNTKMSLYWIMKHSIGSIFYRMRIKAHKKKMDYIKKTENQFTFLREISKRYKDVKSLQQYELMSTNLPVLLRYEDKNSMRHSIETRLPFIDYKTLEYALNIPSKYKVKEGWTKYIARKILATYVPNSVVWRKNKFGFNSPEAAWQKGIKEKMKYEIKNSLILDSIIDKEKLFDKYDSINDRIKWRMYNIAVWERIYNVKIK